MVRKTRRQTLSLKQKLAVAVFQQDNVKGTVVAKPVPLGVQVHATFSKLPTGKHGFHIHKAGDLRGEGCQGACAHYHIGLPKSHGGAPGDTKQRHTGDLGNIQLPEKGDFEKTYTLRGVRVQDLWGRSAIVHEDPDDYGLGEFEDSKTTGHSGKRIACAIFGRGEGC